MLIHVFFLHSHKVEFSLFSLLLGCVGHLSESGRDGSGSVHTETNMQWICLVFLFIVPETGQPGAVSMCHLGLAARYGQDLWDKFFGDASACLALQSWSLHLVYQKKQH